MSSTITLDASLTEVDLSRETKDDRIKFIYERRGNSVFLRLKEGILGEFSERFPCLNLGERKYYEGIVIVRGHRQGNFRFEQTTANIFPVSVNMNVEHVYELIERQEGPDSGNRFVRYILRHW